MWLSGLPSPPRKLRRLMEATLERSSTNIFSAARMLIDTHDRILSGNSCVQNELLGINDFVKSTHAKSSTFVFLSETLHFSRWIYTFVFISLAQTIYDL
jgi:hypothetical protein